MDKIILLIDDDEEEFLILEEAVRLTRMPHYCVHADSAKRAVQLLQEILPDLILLDFNMPLVNGVGCLAMIRQLECVRHIPIAIYSNDAGQSARLLAMANGIVCLPKPPTIKQLADCLVALIPDDEVVHRY